jgi:Pvc16 N-terminal domain
MSNYLAIATVTAALQRLLQSSIQADVEGARVTTVRPENLGAGTPEVGVNLFLYQVTQNPVWGNSNVPGRQRRGEATRQSQTPLDLHYLISFYGNDVEMESQRLLGSAIRTLDDSSILTRDLLRETINDSNFRFLAESDLADQTEKIQISQIDLELDELTSLWSSFFQSPYMLSCTYKISVLLLDGSTPSRRALPVRDRQVAASPFSIQPVIEQIISESGRYQPITRESVLLVRGSQLQSGNTQVRIGSALIAPLSVTATQVRLALSALPIEALRAGVQGLRIVHCREESLAGQAGRQNRSTAIATQKIVESNVEAFILRPELIEISVTEITSSDDEFRSVDVLLTADLSIAPDQRVVLALNQRHVSEPNDYLFEAEPRAENTDRVTVRIRNIFPGEYLARLIVDGAESLLEIDTNPNSPTYEQYINPLLVLQ